MEGPSAESARSRTRSLTPPAASLFAVACQLLMVATAARSPVADPDVFWIAAAGKRMLLTHAVPRENYFSFTDPHHPWVMHEWLLGVPYALGFEAWGPSFFAAVSVLLVCAGAWLLFSTMRHPLALGAGAVALLLFGQRLTSARPIALSELFGLLMILLAGRRSTWAVTGLSLVWANAHGSFPLGLVILGALHPRGLLFAAPVTLLNPYGWKLHALVADYAFGVSEGSRLIRRHVLEFSPIWRAEYHVVVGPMKLVGLAVLAVLAIWAVRRPERRRRAALALFFLASALFMARQVDLAGLLATALLFGDFVDVPRVYLPPAFALLCGLLLVRSTEIDPSLGGSAFVRLSRQLPDGAKVYVPFRDGGLLLALHASRGIRTFFDSRNDCYSPATLRVGFDLKDGIEPEGGVEKALAGTEYVLVPEPSYVESAPAYDARWRALSLVGRKLHGPVIARDGGWMILRYTAVP